MMVIIPCIAEIAASDTPERVKKLRLGAVSELQRYLHYYRQLGYVPKLLYAIADKKCRMIVSATTKAEMQKLIRPNGPHYDGAGFIPAAYSVPEEELICWSETSLKALYESIIGLYRGSLLPRYDFYHWLMPKTLYYQNKFLHYMKRYLSMLYREKNYLRVQELSMDLLSIDMYESEVHYYLIKAMFMSGSKTLSQIYFRQAEPYLTDEHMQEVKTLFTSCRT